MNFFFKKTDPYNLSSSTFLFGINSTIALPAQRFNLTTHQS